MLNMNNGDIESENIETYDTEDVIYITDTQDIEYANSE